MSHTEVIDADPRVDLEAVGTPAPVRSTRALWTWAAFACLLLGTSGAIRVVQQRQHHYEMNLVDTCPFPLKEIPRTLKELPPRLGVWRLKEEGGEQSLDSLTMRVTGGTDHILRIYVDELTGVSLVVLVLFGPAEPVLPHTPEACYPASGYSGAQDPMYREIEYMTKDSSGADVKHKASFRSSVYEKAGGLPTVRREEAYHSFRLEGQWSPDVAMGRKFPRHNPSVFKIQVQRLVVPGEDRERDNPVDQFLATLLPEIERRIAAAPPSTSVLKPVASQ